MFPSCTDSISPSIMWTMSETPTYCESCCLSWHTHGEWSVCHCFSVRQLYSLGSRQHCLQPSSPSPAPHHRTRQQPQIITVDVGFTAPNGRKLAASWRTQWSCQLPTSQIRSYQIIKEDIRLKFSWLLIFVAPHPEILYDYKRRSHPL